MRIPFRSVVDLEVVSADAAGALGTLTANGIEVQNLCRCSDIQIRFQLSIPQRKRALELLTQRGDQWKEQGLSGPYLWGKSVLRRPVLLLTVLCLLAATVLLPRYVFFYEVEGNLQIPEGEILAVAMDSGLHFGASREKVRSEQIKNAMLEKLDSLQWVGINTKGCVAQILVRERIQAEKTALPITNLVASQDGVVTRVVLQSGDARCSVGQAVQKGQLLIAPYTDCGLKILMQEPKGEVYARTHRSTAVVSPETWLVRGDKTQKQMTYAIQIGKKRINLSPSSGNLPPTCAKMIAIKQLTLPGGFRLPVYWIRETYELSPMTQASMPGVEARLQQFDRQRLLAGNRVEILEESSLFRLEEGLCYLRSTYICEEMIASRQQGKIYEGDTNDHG